MSIAENLQQVKEKITEAAVRSGRDPESVKIVAVSKTHTVEIIKEAYDIGIKTFGENRIQEAIDKIPLLPGDIDWHMIGHLQSNKAKHAVEFFNVIQSVDSIKIASKIEAECAEINKNLKIMIQLDLAREETKFGVEEESFFKLCDYVKEYCPHMELIGLMCIPPLFIESERTRPYFKSLREYLELYNDKYPNKIHHLSMGMSNDYEVAVEEGATIVRIGTAIFGERNK